MPNDPVAGQSGYLEACGVAIFRLAGTANGRSP
jgi:hypothetical protein